MYICKGGQNKMDKYTTRTLKQINEDKQDFKVCTKCGHICYYQNKECVECEGKQFHKITEIEISECLEEFGGTERIRVR